MTDDAFAGMQFSEEERAQIERLLEEGDALEHEHDIHPVVRHVIHLCLEEDGETWRKSLPEERKAAIEAYLDQVRDVSMASLGKAVFDLIRLAVFMDHEKKLGLVAYELFAIGNEAVVRFGLLQTVDNVESADEVEKAAHRMTGAEAKKQAPAVDDEKPEGAVSLDKVTPWRRI